MAGQIRELDGVYMELRAIFEGQITYGENSRGGKFLRPTMGAILSAGIDRLMQITGLGLWHSSCK